MMSQFTATTTGIGTGASFYVHRNSGTVSAIYVNRPGVGYTNGEYVTLSPARYWRCRKWCCCNWHYCKY
jgi:hypothetical protein